MSGFEYKWKTYYQDQPKTVKDYTPSYTKYQTTRPTSTYNPTAYSDKSGAYASEIAQARAALSKTNANKPGAYTSQYNDRINALIDQISGRKFQYDAANDSAYQLMKENYMNLGRQAAADTAGQAAALTGGYGNSYGTVAANQAYQSYLNQLNDRIPELQQMALAQYQQEGADLQNQYNMLSDRDVAAYQKYRDNMTDWQNDRSYYDSSLNNLRSMNQSVWGQNEQNKYNANNQAWDTYMRLAAMNDSNYWNAQNIGTERWKQAWNNFWDGIDKSETAQQNSWQRASTDYWNGQDMDYKNRSLNETMRSNMADEAYKNAALAETIRSNKANEKIDQSRYSNSSSTNGTSSSTTSSTNNGTTSGATYKSSYSMANNGNNRFSNPGTLFTEQQYNGFRQSVGQFRGDEGRSQLIEDAYMEGKITSKQADELLKNFGISAKKFAMYRGIVQNTSKNSTSSIAPWLNRK